MRSVLIVNYYIQSLPEIHTKYILACLDKNKWLFVLFFFNLMLVVVANLANIK